MTKSRTPRLAPGDAVEWETSQGPTRGKVVRKQTSKTKIKDHVVAASPEEPQYIVQSDKTGAQAAHKAKALRRT